VRFFGGGVTPADWLIVGLGNPGRRYEGTPHNVGFEVARELIRRWDLPEPKKKFKGLLTDGRTGPGGPRVAVLLPQTYMNVAGDSAAMLRVQRASARYFQRPDRQFGNDGGFLGCSFFNGFYRPGATSMRGLATYLRMAKDGGNLNWEGQLNVRTPGFEVNDISFLSRADYVQQVGNFSYNWTKPTSWYRDFAFIVGGQQAQNFDGELTNRDVHYWMGSQTPQFWRWNAWVLHNFQAYDDRLMRGGPVAVNPWGQVVSADVDSELREPGVVNVNPRFQRPAAGGFQSSVRRHARRTPA
jgi:hypothetical protein